MITDTRTGTRTDMEQPEEQDVPSTRFAHHFFGALGTAHKTVTWNGHQTHVELRVLEAEEVRRAMHFAADRTNNNTASDEYLGMRAGYV